MGDMLDLTTNFDSEDPAISSTRRGTLLVDIQTIVAVSASATDAGVCSVVLSFGTKVDDDGNVLRRWVLTPVHIDDLRSLLATKRTVLTAPRAVLSRSPAPTVVADVKAQPIKVQDGWFCETFLSLPRSLVPSFVPGYKFHVNSSDTICPGWQKDNANRNFILDYVDYDGGDEASTCMSSERNLADLEQRRILGRTRDKAVANAKALIKTGQGAFDMATLDPLMERAQKHLTEAPFKEFCKYVARVPSRFGPRVGDLMLNGKSFEDAVELGSTYLRVAVQKKLDSLLRIKKNHRNGTPQQSP